MIASAMKARTSARLAFSTLRCRLPSYTVQIICRCVIWNRIGMCISLAFALASAMAVSILCRLRLPNSTEYVTYPMNPNRRKEFIPCFCKT